MKLKPAFLIAIGICMLTYSAIGQTVLSGTYNENFFMTKANSPYFVKDSAIFNCDELSIQSGVIVTFKYHPDPEKKAYIRINGDVRVDAVGGTDPVIFTSERDNQPYDLNGDGTASRPAPGDWGYVYFDPQNIPEPYLILMDVTMRYGGGKKFDDESDPGKYPMAVISDYNAPQSYTKRVDFRYCTFEYSAGFGVITGMAELLYCKVRHNNYGIRIRTSDGYFANNEIHNNRIYPVFVKDPVTKRDGNEDYNVIIESFYGNEVYNNGVDAIALEGTVSCEYDENDPPNRIRPYLFAPDPPLPYLITNDLVIDSVSLVIDEGNLIKFLPEAYTGKPINISMKNGGMLSAYGKEDARIIFTSLHDHQYDFSAPKNTDAKPVPGDWGVISGDLTINHTVFKYGGKYISPSSRQMVPDSSVVLHITGDKPGEFGINNCVFSNLYAHAFHISEKAILNSYIYVTNNSFFLGQNRYGIATAPFAEPSEKTVEASQNFWNGRLGPFHPTLNIQGNGCMVGDHVDFSGFRTVSADSLENFASVIRGQVRDLDGLPVKNALIRLKSKKPRAAYTDRNGQFYLSNIKPGLGYKLDVLAKAHRDTMVAPLNIVADTSLMFSFNLKAYTIDYAIDTSGFRINPENSVVAVGGSAHRYYRILDINTLKPVYGAEVIVPDLDTFYTNSAGIVDIEIPASKVGNAFASKSFYIQRVGIETLDFPVNERESFFVSVFPYQYNKIWSGNTYFKVGIFGFEAKKERGAALDLFVKNSGSGEYADSIRMSRQSRTGFGLNFGASAKVEAGPVSAGAEAGVGVNLDAIFEDDFKFDYPNSTGRLAVAKFIVLADGALPYMDAPLIRYFVSCLERQVSEIEAAALTNGIGMNLHAQASAEAGLDLNVLEGDVGTIGAELKGSASASGDITFMSKLYVHKNPVTNQYPLDLDFSYTGEVELGVNASIGFDLGKLFGDGEDGKKDSDDNGTKVDEVDSNLPFPVPDEDFGFDLAAANASGGIKYGLHFGTTRFVPDPWCRMGFMYGYKYNLSANALLLGEAGISENREIRYTFDFYDDQTLDMIRQTADLAKTMLSPDNLINLDISDLTSGKIFNGPLNDIAYQQTRNSFSLAPVPYTKTITDQVAEGGFKIGIDIGIAVVKAKFGAGFSYAEVNNYPKEYGVFHNWKLYPMETYDYLAENEAFSAGPILQDIISKSASYLVSEIKKKLIPPIFRKIKIWPFNKKGEYMFPIGPGSRNSYVHFADSAAVVTIEGIDSLDVIYWDWYGTGDTVKSSKSACAPERLAICEYVKKGATAVHKLDYGVGGFYQFEPYNTSVGDNEVYVIINYFDDELEVVLSDSSAYTIDENELRVYKEDKENNRWVFIGGVADTASNTVMARIDAFGTFTLAPFIPSGEMVLSASPDTIHLEDSNTSTITSNLIRYNTDLDVEDGELFTLNASRGAFLGIDADPTREGFQVSAAGGIILAQYEANDFSGSVKIKAESLKGDAAGSIELFVADSVAPEKPLLAGIEIAEEAVHLWWQKSGEQDIVRYLVHYDTISGGPYQGVATVFGDPSPLDAGLDSMLNVSGLKPGKTYYFSITAIDRCGNMSAYSNELFITTVFNHRPVFYHKVIHIDPDLPKGTVVDTLLATDEDEGQALTYYLADNNTEDAFSVDPQSGILTVDNEVRLNYFLTRVDTFLLRIGVRDDAVNPFSDEGLVMVVLNVETWVPAYRNNKASALELYPNPSSGYFTVKLGGIGLSEDIRLCIYGTDGRCCFSERFEDISDYELEVAADFLEQGVYHVVLETAKERRTGKLVVVE